MADDGPGFGAYEAPDGDEIAAPESFGDRVAGSLGSLLAGLALVVAACIGLFWNEGHSVRVANALIEAGGRVETVPTARRDPSLDGRLVHVSGQTTSAGGVADEAFGVRARGLKLSRRVEMYQWTEKESGSGGDRKYTYSRRWETSPVASSDFEYPLGHTNPPFPAYQTQEFGAADAAIEGFPVGAEAVMRLRALQPYPVPVSGVSRAQATAGRLTQVSEGQYYVGIDPAAPRIGDVRIAYHVEPEEEASFIGVQQPDGLRAYRAGNGEDVLLGYAGLLSADQVIAKGQADNALMTWIIRAVGLSGLLLGFCLFFAPVNLIASYVPLLGSLVSGATFVVALAATIVVGPSIIALAWLAYRPLFSVGLIAAALVIGFGLYFWRGRGRPVAAPGPAAA